MGRGAGTVPNKTTKVVKDDPDRIPYRTYHRFKAEVPPPGGADTGGNKV